ncbi:hypothetical protein F183_A50140 [Bryobacterales bacterium F-183]|nr:hypothetical protein F183_A50140 [Bryobacterales bacterium F-183]
MPAAKPSPFRNAISVTPAMAEEEDATAVRLTLESGLSADAFDWESFGHQVEESADPIPPEAPAWEHPITFAAPPEVPALLMIEAEWQASPLFPAMPEQDIPIRYPKPVRRKAAMPEAARSPLTPAQPERVGSRGWEVSLGLPAWKPQLSIVLAPAVGQPLPVTAEIAVPPPPPPVAEAPVESVVSAVEEVASAPLPAQAEAPAAPVHQEVFVDLSVLEKLGLV